jgi:hypothetical protein
LALGAVTGSGESPPSSSWVVDSANSNGNGAGEDENKKINGDGDSESNSRTASAGAGLDDGGSTVENGLSCGADQGNDDIVEVNGEDLKDTIDLDSVAGALREVRLDA